MKIVLVGHGHFATGIYSSLQLIAGDQENVEAIDFVEGMSADELKQKILLAISNEEKVLILSDLLGGTPFKVSSTIMVENPTKTMNVLSGLNLAMLMEAVFARMAHGFDEVAEEFKMKGQYPLAKLSDYLKHATVKEIEPKDFTIPEVVASIKEDMELMLADAKKIREVAAAEDDFTISNLMEDHVAYYVKQLWFLEAMSK